MDAECPMKRAHYQVLMEFGLDRDVQLPFIGTPGARIQGSPFQGTPGVTSTAVFSLPRCFQWTHVSGAFVQKAPAS